MSTKRFGRIGTTISECRFQVFRVPTEDLHIQTTDANYAWSDLRDEYHADSTVC